MMIKKLNKFTLLIGLAGLGTSLYALILHIKMLMSPGGGSFCDINTTINCSSVISSKYGELFSIPLGAYGMAYFAFILSAALLPKYAQITQKQLAKIELLIASAGVLVVGGLVFVSYSILKMVCPTCTIIHTLVMIYAFLKIFQFMKSFKQQETSKKHVLHETYVRFFAFAMCLSLPPLMAGMLSPVLVNYFAPKTSKPNIEVIPPIEEIKPEPVPVIPEKLKTSAPQKNVKSTPTTSPKPVTKSSLPSERINTLINNDMMSFNKSNYVGDGEDYRRGSDEAPIVVQIFSDFGCPHCKTANDALIKAQNIVGLDKVILVYRFYPLSNECNSSINGMGWYIYNCSLVVATRCAGQQGKFWEFKEWAFEGQNWTDQTRAQKFSTEGLTAQANNLKIDSEAFVQCLKSHSEDNKIKDDIIIANQLNIQGTPMIIINGSLYKGALDSNSFVRVFEDHLK